MPRCIIRLMLGFLIWEGRWMLDVGCWMLGGRGVLALRCDKDRDGKY